MNRFVALTAFLFVSSPGLVPGGDDPVAWETSRDGHGELRTGIFELADFDCAYEFMADTDILLNALKHLEKVEIHEDLGYWQDATYYERFFLVGLSRSRYHRTLNSKDEISWVLIDGRQKRHDGTWKVVPSEGGAQVRFDNVIEAKSRLHNGLLRRIQRRTMNEISKAALERCGRP